MVTKEAFQDPHKEVVGWENFLGMTIGQAVVWASQNIDPKHINPELTTSEPYVMGSHATCSGAWASGPEDYAPAEYQWGYNRMMTVEGLFGAGDTIGGTAHKFSSGSFTEGRIAAKAAVKYVNDMRNGAAAGERAGSSRLRRRPIYQPLENYRVGRNEIVAGTVSPSYLLPIHGLQRLEKIMDEYVGGIGTNVHDERQAARARPGAARNAEGGHETAWAPRTCTSFSALGSCITGCSPRSR